MKRISTLFAIAGLAAAFGGSATAAGPTPVTIAMKDPGCHWFLVAGKYKTHLTVAGPASVLNLDEDTVRIVSAKGAQLEKVGRHVVLKAGTYRITMVGQASDDNHLLLVVK